ncbi:hypothetical protein [Asticcacaulis sp. AND118]|uniref:hypothetical protein n=1 Tax=Asticcacaulis sp. AND118 TaxID=2840468 RepID=UPI001CFF73A4|nr:hypothetical protein [Asticcacaulis sp. AND118]UDF04055.1 hypothetical protein LH365_03135 [Asticcacaulis sp. AND118]
MNVNAEDFKRLVQNYSTESEGYLRQLHLWLGAALAGGVVALTSLAAGLPNPAKAFAYLLPSYWSFLVGLVAVGVAIFAASMKASKRGQHFASAYNRQDLDNNIGKIPEVLHSSPSMANELNSARNWLAGQREAEHKKAEAAWDVQTIWQRTWAASLCIAGASFVIGFAWPLVQIGLGRPLGDPEKKVAERIEKASPAAIADQVAPVVVSRPAVASHASSQAGGAKSSVSAR